jgi:predicted PurR-regulated permease PerM
MPQRILLYAAAVITHTSAAIAAAAAVLLLLLLLLLSIHQLTQQLQQLMARHSQLQVSLATQQLIKICSSFTGQI